MKGLSIIAMLVSLGMSATSNGTMDGYVSNGHTVAARTDSVQVVEMTEIEAEEAEAAEEVNSQATLEWFEDVTEVIEVTAPSVTTEATLSVEFVNYLNAQRAAMGLNAVAWDDGMAAEALKRANDIVVNTSHDGSGNYLENILVMSSDNYVDWYNAWNGSPVHKATMENKYLTTGAAAFITVDGSTYAVFIANEKITADDIAEMKDNGEMTVINTRVTEDGTEFQTWSTAGGSVADEETAAKGDELLKSLGLIP